MNLLGMGPMELLVILALALVVFGPQKLPEIGAQIGRAVRDFRRATSELSTEFNRSLQLELDERRTDGRVPGGRAPTSEAPPSVVERPELEAPKAPDAPKGDSDLLPPY